MTPYLCQVRFPAIVKGCPAHEAGRQPVTLVERIEHHFALSPGDRRDNADATLLHEALVELRKVEPKLLEIARKIPAGPVPVACSVLFAKHDKVDE